MDGSGGSARVKRKADPRNPAWGANFEECLGVKMPGALLGRWTLRLLCPEQDGTRPVCHRVITAMTGWDNHPIAWRTRGGKGTIGNRVLTSIRIATSRSIAKA